MLSPDRGIEKTVGETTIPLQIDKIMDLIKSNKDTLLYSPRLDSGYGESFFIHKMGRKIFEITRIFHPRKYTMGGVDVSDNIGSAVFEKTSKIWKEKIDQNSSAHLLDVIKRLEGEII